jgi:Tfp pilus assembly protein PilF
LRLALEKVPLLALSAASSWVTLKAQHAVVQSFEEFSPANRIQNALISYGLYLWKTVWPANLGFYPHPYGSLPLWKWMLSALILISVTLFVIVLRNKRYLPVGWFWFLGTLVPVLGLVQVGEYAMADRYAYIPLIGIFIMIAWGTADLAQTRHLRPVWLAIPAVCVLAGLAAATVHQISYWQSDYDLYAHTLELEETSFAHNAVAMALLNPAAALTREDVERFPSEPARMDEARHHFERALELRQARQVEGSLWDRAGTLNNLANLDRVQNRLGEARDHDEAALKIYRQLAKQNPDVYLPYLAVTLNNLGAVNRLQNQLDEARLDYEESLSINWQLVQQNPVKYLPNLAMVLNEYGRLEASQGRPESARAHYEEALSISRQLAQQSPEVYLPQLAMTLTNFGLLDAFQQRMDDARQHFEEALKIERELSEQNATVYLPNLVMALSNLGRVELLQGRISESRAHYTEAYDRAETLVRENRAYAGELAQIEASLQQLEKMSARQSQPAAGRVSH